jgi:hypothetical protein
MILSLEVDEQVAQPQSSVLELGGSQVRQGKISRELGTAMGSECVGQAAFLTLAPGTHCHDNNQANQRHDHQQRRKHNDLVPRDILAHALGPAVGSCRKWVSREVRGQVTRQGGD